MSQEKNIEVYKQHRDHQNRYAYFLLAASASAIVLSVNNTAESALSYFQIPLGLAVLCWGLSFFFGCRYLNYVGSTLFANMALFKVERGTDKRVGNHPEMIQTASEGIREAMESNSEKASFYAKGQFRFLITGAIFYLAWHVIGMWLRT